jgi:hypothetical protein
MKANVKNAKPINAASSSSPILGTYEGEALDTNITNNNGLDITSEVIEAVLESEDYAVGIENGWFIGFLGHPEDPNCMDFKDGCIVLTDMELNSDGKVHASFNLLDTPVGRVVKTLQDAGIKFGISIRGAGDIIDQSVDPDTFVFRGYDLVSFPAYPNSIPTFTEIAASTNIETQKKYKAVCAAVRNNLSSITSASTINVIQSQFAPQSEEYAMMNRRKAEIENCQDDNLDISDQKIEAMTQLYLDTLQNVSVLASQLESMKQRNAAISSASRRKISALKRITASQLHDALSGLDSVTASCDELKHKNAILCAQLADQKEANLIYKQKVENSTNELKKKNKIIASLQSELRETVTASSKIKASASNLGVTNDELQSELRVCKKQLGDFQNAYASMYAAALGVDLAPMSIKSSTSVDELQDIVAGATNTINMPSAVTVEPVYLDDEVDNDDLATL